jgi:hypothetical protein
MMRNLALVAVLMISFCTLAVAQELPQYEVFGGWSYFRPEGGPNEMTPTHGWNASLNVNLNEWFSIVLDGGGNYTRFQDTGTLYVIEEGQEEEPDPDMYMVDETRTSSARAHTFTVGMRFTFREHEKIHPFYHALFGVRHSASDDYASYVPGYYRLPNQEELREDPSIVKVWVPEVYQYYYDVRDNFLMIFGGGLDVAINEKWSVRAFQADYQIERDSGDFSPNIRVSAGVVYNIGER